MLALAVCVCVCVCVCVINLGAEGGDHVEKLDESHFSRVSGNEDIQHPPSKRIFLSKLYNYAQLADSKRQ